MTTLDLLTLLPFIAIPVAALVTMLVVAFRRGLMLTTALTSLGLLFALGALPLSATTGKPMVAGLFIVDRFALFYTGMILVATLVVVVFSHGYMRHRVGEREEYFILLLLAAFGAAALVASSHFASFFLGLEILSVSLYSLIAYTRYREWSIEAGIKYLVLASTSAAFLLLGMALIYAELGTMEFARIAAETTSGTGHSTVLIAATVLLIVGIGFKLAVVPFHMWTPDVYEGASAPATAFVATVSKGAVFALLLRYFVPIELSSQSALFLAFGFIAVASMLTGNLLALVQSNIKRMLAYSSIAHLGYLLVAFLSGGTLATTVVTFYLAAYFATTLGAFGVVTALSRRERDADSVSSYAGLVWRRPVLGTVLTLTLLSLAGIPPAAGFFAKFYVAMAGVSAQLWALVFALVLSSAIGLFYYLRLAITLYAHPSAAGGTLTDAPSLTAATSLTLVLLAAVLLAVGIYPAPLLDLISSVVAGVP